MKIFHEKFGRLELLKDVSVKLNFYELHKPIIIMYAATDYVEMIIIYGECGRNARETARVFAERFPDRNRPDHKVVLRAIARTQETGQVAPMRDEAGGRPRNARTLENEEAILNAFEEDGTRSIREVAGQLDINRSLVHRVLKSEQRHPYHYTRVQHLQAEDYPARMEFCTWLLNQEELESNVTETESEQMFEMSTIHLHT